MKLPRLILAVFFIILSCYLMIPSSNFPEPPVDSLQSNEPGDIESTLRRSYFTNYLREEVMDHYSNQFAKSKITAIQLPSYALNYPPEDAQTKIRDQARSTYLEEIVHPFRESIFVNGFEPKDPKDAIEIAGKPWRQKITIRYYPSNVFFRLFAMVFMALSIWYLVKEYWKLFPDFKKLIKK